MNLVYSQEAAADLARLRAFITEHDPQAAARIATELITRIENIRLFPQMRRSVELAPAPASIRDAVFGRYIIRYSAQGEALVILRIWHHYEERPQRT